MTTAGGGILPERKPGGDVFYYLLAAMSGALAGWLDIKVGDLLLTAMVVLAANMLLGFLSPRSPWRWVVLVGVFVPVVEWLAYLFLAENRRGRRSTNRSSRSCRESQARTGERWDGAW